jgi:hypothetical protein
MTNLSSLAITDAELNAMAHSIACLLERHDDNANWIALRNEEEAERPAAAARTTTLITAASPAAEDAADEYGAPLLQTVFAADETEVIQ